MAESGFTERLGVAGLCRHAIERWRLLVVVSLGCLTLALFAWWRIARLENPRVEPGAIRAIIAYPGAAPENVEAQVIRQLEDAVYAIDGVDYVESTAEPSRATFYVKLVDGTPIDATVEKVRGLILARRRDLPAQVEEPQVAKVTTARLVQMVVAIAGERSDSVLSATARQLKQELLDVSGVASASLRGEAKHQIVIRLDPLRLAQHHLGPEDVASRLKTFNVRAASGVLRIGNQRTLLQVDSELDGADAIRHLPISAQPMPDGTTRWIRLSELAEVEASEEPTSERFMLDGAPAVGIELRYRPDRNAVDVSQRVRERLHGAERELPTGVVAQVVHDEGWWVDRALRSLSESLGEGSLLVMLVVTLGIGWRAGLVVALVLPLAVGGGLIGLSALGFALDQISIGGLIVAIGLLIDDAVVVSESVQLMRDRGLSAIRAAVVGTARVFWANNATTAVACAAFVPLFFTGGAIGQFVTELPVAVVFALLASLLIAQLLTPWVASRMIRPHGSIPPLPDGSPFDSWDDLGGTGASEKNFALRWLKGSYLRVMESVVRRPVTWIAGASLLLGLCSFWGSRVEIQFFPKSERECLFVNVQLPPGTDLQATAATAVTVQQVLAQQAEIEHVTAVVGGGFPPVFVGRSTAATNASLAEMLLQLHPGSSPAQVALRLRQLLQDVSGARISVEELYQGPPVPHPILVRIFGEDLATLRGYARGVQQQLLSTPGVINVENGLEHSLPMTKVGVDSMRLAQAGSTPALIAERLRLMYSGDEVTEFGEGDAATKVVLGLKEAFDHPTEQLAQALAGGVRSEPSVSLSTMGQSRLDAGYAELRRRNTRRFVEVMADTDGSVLASRVVRSLDQFLAAQRWEPGYGYSHGGADEETRTSFRKLTVASFGAILLISLLLVLMFNAFGLSLCVLLAIPYAAIGIILGLLATHQPFGFMSFLGSIALLGVYVNHKIYFIDRYRQLRRRGMEPKRALIQAGVDRMRPVVLTGLTAVLGLVPLTVLGGEMWASFGSVNIFGLLFSIPLSLLVLPAFILCIEGATQRLFGRRRSSSSDTSEGHPPLTQKASPGAALEA